MKTTIVTRSARANKSSPIAVAKCDGAVPSPEVLEDVPPCRNGSPAYEDEPFEATTVQFPDGSRWVMADPLSQINLQQTCSPCEARQVFTALCLEDPTTRHIRGEEAVIKTKFRE